MLSQFWWMTSLETQLEKQRGFEENIKMKLRKYFGKERDRRGSEPFLIGGHGNRFVESLNSASRVVVNYYYYI
jgi:hypothetical protein